MGAELNLFHRQKSASDVARAVGLIEIIDHQDAVFGYYSRPGVTQVTIAAVVPKNNLRSRFDMLTIPGRGRGARTPKGGGD